MVMFEPAANNILVEAIRSRESGEMMSAYQVLVDRLKERCMLPRLHILNNKWLAEFKATIQHNSMRFQLVPPNDHR